MRYREGEHHETDQGPAATSAGVPELVCIHCVNQGVTRGGMHSKRQLFAEAAAPIAVFYRLSRRQTVVACGRGPEDSGSLPSGPKSPGHPGLPGRPGLPACAARGDCGSGRSRP
jgi:hypothetical protein